MNHPTNDINIVFVIIFPLHFLCFVSFSVCCRSPLIPVRPNYSSGDILSGSMNGSLPRSSGGSAATTGSAPNLTRIGGRRSSNRDASPDSGTQSWTNGWHVGSYSVCDKNMG